MTRNDSVAPSIPPPHSRPPHLPVRSAAIKNGRRTRRRRAEHRRCAPRPTSRPRALAPSRSRLTPPRPCSMEDEEARQGTPGCPWSRNVDDQSDHPASVRPPARRGGDEHAQWELTSLGVGRSQISHVTNMLTQEYGTGESNARGGPRASRGTFGFFQCLRPRSGADAKG